MKKLTNVNPSEEVLTNVLVTHAFDSQTAVLRQGIFTCLV